MPNSTPAAGQFRASLMVRWSDIDFLSHMKNTVYLDAAVDVRFLYFESRGLTARHFTELGIGPVVRRDDIEFFRELRFLERYTVSNRLAGASQDFSRFMLRNEFFREDGKMAARLTSSGGWLDLKTRRLVVPPAPLAEALGALERAEDFAPLPSSVRDE